MHIGQCGNADHPLMLEQGNSLSGDAVGTRGWDGLKRQSEIRSQDMHGRLRVTIMVLGQAVLESQIAGH